MARPHLAKRNEGLEAGSPYPAGQHGAKIQAAVSFIEANGQSAIIGNSVVAVSTLNGGTMTPLFPNQGRG